MGSRGGTEPGQAALDEARGVAAPPHDTARYVQALQLPITQSDFMLPIALVLLIFFIIAQPDMGYWGMALSYVLSGVGILLIRAARPEPRRAK